MRGEEKQGQVFFPNGYKEKIISLSLMFPRSGFGAPAAGKVSVHDQKRVGTKSEDQLIFTRRGWRQFQLQFGDDDRRRW